ncbi:extracellular solute-binding protein [Pseudoalteromonas denitrificans]|uniref:Carbohydrate ABC transporter substrate-binding protein, CUT1 family n=1 Tax=Pseudoalteromonas denitrificans DSM 6059 TaxID=1123010 RepID=A0A1I1MAA7_9GAMM|nr:extracellular solute-binding protein [Pseudoalteromonas denitrificans]SFC81732.1 carbohydrate ABC transporter substrate-binding protein, CUT1 family [Pseudoalteromonas denitrificans DSM 6059]
MNKNKMLIITYCLFFASMCMAQNKSINEAALERWATFFSPSAIDKAEKIKELRWFAHAAQEYQGLHIRSVAEEIKTHQWESEVLSRAFEEITGITVDHKIIGEGQIVRKMMDQLMTGRLLFDIYVNDADMIGTHLRLKKTVNLTQYMKNEGKKYTNPDLHLTDFMNLEFGQDYDGDQLQLPDQQFVNLYWFRYDWFSRKDIKTKFKKQYGYELGVPLNWAAYEDIAAFFTGMEIDGVKVYGHLDYGKKSPSLGWRFTDAWLSIAGVGDKGLPNGSPVDEWGIRVENRIPVGSTVSRGGALNSPAAVYALTKYIDWLKKYAPPQAINWRWLDAGPKAAEGNIAQRIFQYVTWLSDDAFYRPGSKLSDAQGSPKWRVAPTPHGRYWDPGMKVGYQDAGSWTIPKNVKGKRRNMAWLWAQFCVSKTVSLKKFLVGGTPVRKSTIDSEHLTKYKDKWGGLIDFYRSKQRVYWTDTGVNVPHYPALSAAWWPKIAKAINGQLTPKQAMDAMAVAQDEMMAKVRLKAYSPKLALEKPESYWLEQPGSPKPMRTRPKPKTIAYEALLKQWRNENDD